MNIDCFFHVNKVFVGLATKKVFVLTPKKCYIYFGPLDYSRIFVLKCMMEIGPSRREDMTGPIITSIT